VQYAQIVPAAASEALTKYSDDQLTVQYSTLSRDDTAADEPDLTSCEHAGQQQQQQHPHHHAESAYANTCIYANVAYS